MEINEKIARLMLAQTDAERKEAIGLFTKRQKEMLQKVTLDLLNRETKDLNIKEYSQILELI